MPEPNAITHIQYIRLDQALEICDQWAEWAVTSQGKQIADTIRRQLMVLETITLSPAPAKAERKQP